MSHLIVLSVDDPNHYLAVLEAWDKVGVSNVTIHAITNFDRIEHPGLRDDLPLIPSLQHFLRGEKRHNYVLLAAAESAELVEKLVANAHQIMSDLEDPGEGHLFVVPVSQALSWTKQTTGEADHRKFLGLFVLLPAFSAMDSLGSVASLVCNQF